jgi:nucleotide-binding universal stress UspA family protein
VSVSATSALLVVLVVWAVIGMVSGLVMARRGHDRYRWFLLGAVLGPLVVPLWFAAARQEPSVVGATAARAPSGDGLAVLVGIDGSTDATGAMMTALGLFGPLVDRFTVATAVDHDVYATNTPAGARDAAEAALETERQRAAGVLQRTPDAVLLSGRPAEALTAHARSNGYDLVVVGPRGRGASRRLFGSVATALARGVGVPIAILPPAQPRVDDPAASADLDEEPA